MPAWLKGGMIAVLIAILLSLLAEFAVNQCTLSPNVDQCYKQVYFFVKPLWSLMLSLDFIGLFICRGFCPAMNFTPLFTIWPSYFFIGSFFGWLYGRLISNNFIKRN